MSPDADPDLDALLQKDLTERFVEIVRANPQLEHADAMVEAARVLLANNPYCAPKDGSCPVNGLPNELLAYIFQVGVSMAEEEGSDSEDDDEDEDEEGELDSEWETDDDEVEDLVKNWKKARREEGENEEEQKKEEEEEEKERKEEAIRRMPFQMLVSHVCKHWREVALETPTLWTSMSFCFGSSIESAKVWVERSKSQPLDITIDCSLPDEFEVSETDSEDEDEDVDQVMVDGTTTQDQDQDQTTPKTEPDPPILSTNQILEFLTIITPHVDRWRSFRLVASHYNRIYPVLEKLAECPSASSLESLELYHHDDNDEYEFFPETEYKKGLLLFHGHAPKLRSVSFWGVHIDWDASLSFLQGLHDIELAYHANDVRPSFRSFAKMIEASPELETLSLSTSGPAPEEDDDQDKKWTGTIEIPSLKELVLCHHEPEYILPLLPLLSTPSLVSLQLDFEMGDYTEMCMLLASPSLYRRTSLLAGIQQLKVCGLPCNTKAKEVMLEQLVNLRMFNLNCCDEEEVEFFDLLGKVKPTTTPTPTVLYCPALTSLYTTGIDGKQMRALVEARRSGGVPLKRVGMSEEDDVEEKEEKWLKDNVEEVEFFEPDSDFEEVLVEDEVEEEWTDTDDEGEGGQHELD